MTDWSITPAEEIAAILSSVPSSWRCTDLIADLRRIEKDDAKIKEFLHPTAARLVDLIPRTED